MFYILKAFHFVDRSVLHIFVIVQLKFDGKQTKLNQQKFKVMTHDMLDVSFSIKTIQRLFN